MTEIERITPDMDEYVLNKKDPAFLQSICKELSEKTDMKSIGYEEVEFASDDVIAVVNSGDWHLGAELTDYEKWLEDLEYIAKTPGLYVILTGDYLDNFNKSSPGGGVFTQTTSIPVAEYMAIRGIRLIKEKILAILQGCHDEWFFRHNAKDFSRRVSKISPLSYWLGFSGKVVIKRKDFKQVIFAAHKYSRWSSGNPCYGLKDLFFRKTDYDIAFGAHRHIPNIETSYLRSKVVHMLRCGSYKITDRFISQIGLPHSPAVTPTIVLDNKENKSYPFYDMKDAVKFMNKLNSDQNEKK